MWNQSVLSFHMHIITEEREKLAGVDSVGENTGIKIGSERKKVNKPENKSFQAFIFHCIHFCSPERNFFIVR